MKQPHFLHVDTNSQKLKVDLKFFSWAWFRMGVTNLVSGINLNVSQGWTDGIKWIFAYWYKFMQMKGRLKIFGVGMVKSRCGQSGYGALKLTVLEEWSNGINWLYACWCRFTKLNTDLKFLSGRGQKWVWPVWSWKSKIDCISKMNRWNKLTFCMLVQIQES